MFHRGILGLLLISAFAAALPPSLALADGDWIGCEKDKAIPKSPIGDVDIQTRDFSRGCTMSFLLKKNPEIYVIVNETGMLQYQVATPQRLRENFSASSGSRILQILPRTGPLEFRKSADDQIEIKLPSGAIVKLDSHTLKFLPEAGQSERELSILNARPPSLEGGDGLRIVKQKGLVIADLGFHRGEAPYFRIPPNPKKGRAGNPTPQLKTLTVTDGSGRTCAGVPYGDIYKWGAPGAYDSDDPHMKSDGDLLTALRKRVAAGTCDSKFDLSSLKAPFIADSGQDDTVVLGAPAD